MDDSRQPPDDGSKEATPWCEDYWVVAGLDRQTCSGCVAREQGHRCWEVQVSPCCKRPRSQCANCEVYVAYLRSCGARETVEVRTFDGATLVGELYVPAGRRVSEVLNDPDRDFITLANVSIERQYSATSGFCPMLFVNRRSVRTVEPRASGALKSSHTPCHPHFAPQDPSAAPTAEDDGGPGIRRAS